MNFAERTEQHRRLAVLRLLDEVPGFNANESILTDALNALGVASSRDQIRTCLGWLSEQGLISIERPGGIMVAALSQRGGDVAKGLATVDGVQPPSPGG